jgi:hypothetical protein
MAEEKDPKIYSVVQDITLHRPIRVVGEMFDGTLQYETEGMALQGGDYVLAKDIAPYQLEAIKNGEMDQFVQPVSEDVEDDVRAAMGRSGQFSTFVPEHEAEHDALLQAGHQVVDREYALELGSAGAEEAREAQQKAYAESETVRVGLTTPGDIPSLAQAALEGKTTTAGRVGVDSAKPASAQITPSGRMGGQVKADAEKHPEDLVAERAERSAQARKRPAAKKDDGEK